MRSMLIKEQKTLSHLPLVDRVLHPKSYRPLVCVVGGATLMMVGTLIAGHRHELADMCCISHWFWDTCGYFVHGVGCVPAIRYIEPAWIVLMGVAE